MNATYTLSTCCRSAVDDAAACGLGVAASDRSCPVSTWFCMCVLICYLCLRRRWQQFFGCCLSVRCLLLLGIVPLSSFFPYTIVSRIARRLVYDTAPVEPRIMSSFYIETRRCGESL